MEEKRKISKFTEHQLDIFLNFYKKFGINRDKHYRSMIYLYLINKQTTPSDLLIEINDGMFFKERQFKLNTRESLSRLLSQMVKVGLLHRKKDGKNNIYYSNLDILPFWDIVVETFRPDLIKLSEYYFNKVKIPDLNRITNFSPDAILIFFKVYLSRIRLFYESLLNYAMDKEQFRRKLIKEKHFPKEINLENHIKLIKFLKEIKKNYNPLEPSRMYWVNDFFPPFKETIAGVPGLLGKAGYLKEHPLVQDRERLYELLKENYFEVVQKRDIDIEESFKKDVEFIVRTFLSPKKEAKESKKQFQERKGRFERGDIAFLSTNAMTFAVPDSSSIKRCRDYLNDLGREGAEGILNDYIMISNLRTFFGGDIEKLKKTIFIDALD